MCFRQCYESSVLVSIRIQLLTSMRIRILILYVKQCWIFKWKKFFGNKTYLRRCKAFFERLEFRFICHFLSISLRLDPDPYLHSQYLSGFRRAKSMGSGCTTLVSAYRSWGCRRCWSRWVKVQLVPSVHTTVQQGVYTNLPLPKW